MTLETVAQTLRDADTSGIPIAPIRDMINNGKDAYAVQDINTAHRLAQGGRLIGRKVGLTNPVVQKQLGVDQPDYGMLFADMDVPHDGIIPFIDGAQYKVEAEIAFVMGQDLSSPDIGMAEVIRSVDFALPALEIVGSRIANWDIQFTDTVADNGSSAFFTLGPSPRSLDKLDLTGCQMQMTLNGDDVSNGTGRACYGSPLNAVLWLARVMAAVGRPLKEGDVVLSGALGPMVPAVRGGQFVANIDGFGETAVRFGN